MGFLKIFGGTLDWEEIKPHLEKLKKDVVFQYIDAVKSVEGVTTHTKFGYEVNYYF